MQRTQFQNALIRWGTVTSCWPRLEVGCLMKRSLLMLFTVSTLFLPNASAANYAYWGLPDGVKARLGKGYVGSLQFSADGNRLMVENTVGIWVYDAHSGAELDLITGNFSDSLALSRDGSTAAGWGPDDKLCLWRVADGKKKVTLKGDTSRVDRVAFSPDGRTVAGGTLDEEILLWETDTGARKATLLGHTHFITSMAFSPDGATLASGSWDRTVRLWDVETSAHTGTLTAHTGGISKVTFSPDGRTFVSSSSSEDKVILWDVGTWQPKATVDTDINCFAVSPDNRTLATGSWRGELYLWDVVSGTLKAEIHGASVIYLFHDIQSGW